MRRLALAIIALLLPAPSAVQAQSCMFTMPNVDFGSINLTAGVNHNTSVTFRSSCTGIAGRTVRVCPNFNAGSGGVNGSGSQRYMLNGVNQLIYNIYRNAAVTTVWGSRTWGLPPTPPTINVNLTGAGAGVVNTLVRARVPLGQGALPTGLYTSSFAGAQTRVNYAYSTVGNCAAITAANLNPTATPFTVSATAGGACVVSATDMDFGVRSFLNSNIDTSNTISVACAGGVLYRIGLGPGGAGGGPTARELSNGTDSITYGIYSNAARSTAWGDTAGVNTINSTGTGITQTFTAYGRIPPQATPAPDTYDDAIVVTVTY